MRNKGISREHQLVNVLWDNKVVALRSPASGSKTNKPVPDITAFVPIDKKKVLRNKVEITRLLANYIYKETVGRTETTKTAITSKYEGNAENPSINYWFPASIVFSRLRQELSSITDFYEEILHAETIAPPQTTKQIGQTPLVYWGKHEKENSVHAHHVDSISMKKQYLKNVMLGIHGSIPSVTTIAIELKTTNKNSVYVKKKELIDLLLFSNYTHAVPFFVVYFSGIKKKPLAKKYVFYYPANYYSTPIAYWLWGKQKQEIDSKEKKRNNSKEKNNDDDNNNNNSNDSENDEELGGEPVIDTGKMVKLSTKNIGKTPFVFTLEDLFYWLRKTSANIE